MESGSTSRSERLQPELVYTPLDTTSWHLLRPGEAPAQGQAPLEAADGPQRTAVPVLPPEGTAPRNPQHRWRYFGALRRRLEEWIEAAKSTSIREITKVAARLEPHLDSVVAGHRHGLKLGLVESINSKIAALRVQARGYRDPEYFKLKIFQRCSLPDNPWARIVL